jgi:hypothetical protein
MSETYDPTEKESVVEGTSVSSSSSSYYEWNKTISILFDFCLNYLFLLLTKKVCVLSYKKSLVNKRTFCVTKQKKKNLLERTNIKDRQSTKQWKHHDSNEEDLLYLLDHLE